MGCNNSSRAQQLAILSALIAIALAEDRTADEMNVLGNFITAVGTVLLTIAAQAVSQDPNMDNGDCQNGNSQNGNLKDKNSKNKT